MCMVGCLTVTASVESGCAKFVWGRSGSQRESVQSWGDKEVVKGFRRLLIPRTARLNRNRVCSKWITHVVDANVIAQALSLW